MSKKKLLSENEIRRFQGLAGIPALGEGMYGKPMGGRHKDKDEDDLEEGMHEKEGARHKDEDDLEEGMHEKEGARHKDKDDEELKEMDHPMPGGRHEEDPGARHEDDLEMDVEMEPSDEGGDVDLSPEQKEDLAADIVRAVAQELSQALDLDEPIEVETDGGEDLDMDLGADDEEMDLEVDDDAPGARYMEEEEGVFAPNHYCVHHGGVHHEGKIQMAEAVGHNWSKKQARVTHYDMKLEDGTILENVAFEDIQVTNASLAEGHHHGVRDKEEEELDESTNDDLVNEVLRRVVARLSNK
jgi:hypothetical protein